MRLTAISVIFSMRFIRSLFPQLALSNNTYRLPNFNPSLFNISDLDVIITEKGKTETETNSSFLPPAESISNCKLHQWAITVKISTLKIKPRRYGIHSKISMKATLDLQA